MAISTELHSYYDPTDGLFYSNEEAILSGSKESMLQDGFQFTQNSCSNMIIKRPVLSDGLFEFTNGDKIDSLQLLLSGESIIIQWNIRISVEA